MWFTNFSLNYYDNYDYYYYYYIRLQALANGRTGAAPDDRMDNE